jgi:OOP family OmpA-OmpF porin
MLPQPPEADARADSPTNGASRLTEFAELRQLLLGPEQRRLDELADRLETVAPTAGDVAEILPEAIALRTRRDQQLGRALAPTVETALRESIRRNPREIATAIFPVLGPAIRKAISETMASLVRSINHAVEHSLTARGVRWRIEAWRSGVPYADVVIRHALVYRVEQVYLIHAESGLLLAHVAARNLAVPDADLISSMLTAIQDFVRDSFHAGEGATLRTFTVGDHTVQVEAGPCALLAAVVRGQAPTSVTERLERTLESVHLEFSSPLVDFDGDCSPFEQTKPLLEECLETVVSTDRAAAGRRAWLRWAVPLLLLLVAGIGYLVRANVKWGRAVRALEGEPGIVVVESSRGWLKSSVRGLRDPLSRDPSAVLSASGVSAAGVTSEWEPYLSLDSAIVVERVRRALGTPASVGAALRGDTIHLTGSAPLAWFARALRTSSLPGAGMLDLTGVTPTLSPALDSLRRAVESSRVLFDPGSSQLTAAAAGQVRNAARPIERLADSAAAAGVALVVELQGRTDATGTDASNQSLAQLRIDQVVAALRAAGVAPGRLVARPLATSAPLTSAAAGDVPRLNRSVSFVVTLGRSPASR